MNSNEAAADVLIHKFKIGQTVYLERSLAVPGRKDDRMGVPAQFIGTSLCCFVPIADIRTGRRLSAQQHRQLGDVARNPSSRVSKLGLRIARPDSLIESFGFSFCFYEYREILAGL